MNSTDQDKIIDKGFKIIRFEERHPIGGGDKQYFIKERVKGKSWKILEKGFVSKAATVRRMKELLSDPMVVEEPFGEER